MSALVSNRAAAVSRLSCRRRQPKRLANPAQNPAHIDSLLFANFAVLTAHGRTTVCGDTLITFDANNAVTLKNVAPSTLHHSEFTFV